MRITEALVEQTEQIADRLIIGLGLHPIAAATIRPALQTAFLSGVVVTANVFTHKVVLPKDARVMERAALNARFKLSHG